MARQKEITTGETLTTGQLACRMYEVHRAQKSVLYGNELKPWEEIEPKTMHLWVKAARAEIGKVQWP